MLYAKYDNVLLPKPETACILSSSLKICVWLLRNGTFSWMSRAASKLRASREQDDHRTKCHKTRYDGVPLFPLLGYLYTLPHINSDTHPHNTLYCRHWPNSGHTIVIIVHKQAACVVMHKSSFWSSADWWLMRTLGLGEANLWACYLMCWETRTLGK